MSACSALTWTVSSSSRTSCCPTPEPLAGALLQERGSCELPSAPSLSGLRCGPGAGRRAAASEPRPVHSCAAHLVLARSRRQLGALHLVPAFRSQREERRRVSRDARVFPEQPAWQGSRR